MSTFVVKQTIHKYYYVESKDSHQASKKSLFGEEPFLSFVTFQRTVKMPPEKQLIEMLEKTLSL